MSDDKQKPETGGQELYFLDENGRKQDAAFHEEILAGGEDEPGAFDALLEELGLTEAFAATFTENSAKNV
jgi:hypothetical protein